MPLIIDIKPYQTLVTSTMEFTSNYLLFIFNLLAPSDFILNTHKTSLITVQLHHQLRLQRKMDETFLNWFIILKMCKPGPHWRRNDTKYEMTHPPLLQPFEKEQLCVWSCKYDKVDIFYSKSSKYVLCQFQYDWLLICRYLLAKFNRICKFNVK